MQDVRPAAVAGMFYPKAPERLASEVRAYLSHAKSDAARAPKALIVPHAGYVYSGPIAASASTNQNVQMRNAPSSPGSPSTPPSADGS